MADNVNNTISVEEEIISVLDKIRPFIERDGGDIQFEKFEDGIVYVRFLGACLGCAAIDFTLQEGVEAILKEEVPEVIKVVNVDSLTDPNIEEF